jgi:colanic acid biosynthesis glycosyl transferase WcaI
MAHVARRVIFLNRYFYPDHSATSELVTDLAFELAHRGLNVAVITSRLGYEGTENVLPPHEITYGVEVWRVKTSRRGRHRLPGRILDYVSFYPAAGWRLWRIAREGDVIVAKTDPPLLSVMAAWVAWLRGAKRVNWQQDIFPEVAEAVRLGGTPGSVIFTLLRGPRNWSLRRARANVVVGTRMAKTLLGLGIPQEAIYTIPNWADGSRIHPVEPSKNHLRSAWGLEKHFVVGYAGNLGRAHDVDTIVEAITLLHERMMASPADDVARRIIFVFIGGGAQRARLEQEVLRRRLTNVQMYPYQPRERLAETLGAADVHLVSLNPKLEGFIVPSKFYGVAAAGRPTLFIGAADGELARLIDQASCGFTVAPGDEKALVDRIVQLAGDRELCSSLGKRAREAFEQQWDKSRAVEQWAELLGPMAVGNARI